jgi:acetyl-CoA C-acetyltransferase
MPVAQAVIASAVRTPIGAFTGALAGVLATELGAIAVAEAVRRAGIDPAVALAAQAITAGEAAVLVAGGMENVNASPHLVSGMRTGHRMGDVPPRRSTRAAATTRSWPSPCRSAGAIP